LATSQQVGRMYYGLSPCSR